MKRIIKTITVLLLLTACSKDHSDFLEGVTRQAAVTYLVTPNGLGDNGYNDASAQGIFSFIIETFTPVRMLQPKDTTQAEQMYRQWLTDNADKDSAVLILGSSVYEQMARRVPVTLFGKGSRVLLFESSARIDGLSTVKVSRYGASYLCGAMSGGFDALILSAVRNNPLLDESIMGFMAGYNAHHQEGKNAQVLYLADDESGWAMPDSAYRLMARRIRSSSTFREMVFPLLGGSDIGVLRAMNDEQNNLGLVIGMDVDQSALSPRVPFSMIIQTGQVLHDYLKDWLSGRDWPASRTLDMSQGAALIMLHPSFYRHNTLMDYEYRDPDTFLNLYNRFIDEAVSKEQEYENN